jgi:hypothetical protein
MKTSKTIYHLIVDKSGSMFDCIESTVNGFNEQVNSIKSKALEFEDEDITLGLTLFNDQVDHHYFESNPNQVQLLTYQTYRPSGCTALLDAVGETIRFIQQNVVDSKIPATVIVVILTDGYENASKSYNLVNIRNMISELEGTGNWTFSFIGATLDAVEIAKTMAIKQENSFAFNKKEMKAAVWEKLDGSVHNYLKKKKSGWNLNNFFGD